MFLGRNNILGTKKLPRLALLAGGKKFATQILTFIIMIMIMIMIMKMKILFHLLSYKKLLLS